MTEMWRPVVGFEDCYEVSDQGRVRSLDRMIGAPHGRRWHTGRILAPGAKSRGHLFVNLSVDGKRCVRLVHLLVLQTFVGPRPDGMEGCHNNGDPSDNRLVNLRWDTKSENTKDRVRHGTHNTANKTHCPRNLPYSGENLYDAGLGRRCRICMAEQRREKIAAFQPELTDRHGKRTTYVRGCRCTKCRAANADYKRSKRTNP